MARPRTITDDAIKRATREIFVEHGPGAPVSLIAQALNVSQAALFARAGSKEQLMRQALCPGRPRALDQLVEAPPERDVAGALADILLELMTFFEEVVPNLVVLRAAGYDLASMLPPGAPSPPVMMRRALGGWLDAAVTTGSLKRANTQALAEGLLGAMEARCFNRYIDDRGAGPSDDSFIRDLVSGLIAPLEVHTP